jgi:Na+-translocating ferredoxin:NAD+ oxidoreductase RnfG subunit
MKQRVKRLLKKTISIAAWSSVLLAFVFGKFFKKEDYESVLKEQLINIEIISQTDERLTIASSDTSVSHIRYAQAQGYGGELTIAVQYDNTGIIEDVYLLVDRETPSFITKLQHYKFFRQYKEKSIVDNFIVNNDIDAVSGCTVSSIAYTEAVRTASYNAARKDFGWNVSYPVIPWKFGLDELLVFLLIFTAIIALYLKKKWIRYIALALSLGLIGFHLNASISISHFARLMLGFLPGFREHFIWWLLVIVSLAFPFFLKKNLYCYAICPFHAVETALIKISGFQLKLTRRAQKISKTLSLTFLWAAFMLIFLSENPTLGSYEPFALLFSLDGAGLQWYLLPTALIGALLVPDFYCRYFCPVGRTFKLIVEAGIKTRKFLGFENRNNKKVHTIKPLIKTKKAS